MVTPVTRLADFNGKKIRVLGSRFEREAVASVGAAGVPMPNTDVVPALQAKSIEGNRSGITIFVPFKYETVAKHLFREKEAIICIVKIVSKAWLDKLPAELPPVVMEEGLKADVAMQPVTVTFLDNMFKAWSAAGGLTTELSATEQAELHKRYVASAETVVKDSPRLKEIYEQLKAAAARTRN
jgi:TRAP-type C4-dicarboxylate transport system substrate-binding protein